MDDSPIMCFSPNMDGSKAGGRKSVPPAGSGEEAGLRERKAASTRLAVARALARRLQTTALADIRVEDLAADANVSRMTFFNYFPSKDHALDLVMTIWMFDLQVDLERRGLRGVAAIERLFERLGDFVAENPERMKRFLAAFVTRATDRSLPELGRVERKELAPDLADRDLQLLSLGAMLMRATDEARQSGELQIEGTAYEMAHYLGALANGAALIGHSSASETDWRRLYRRHVRRALGLPLAGRAAPTTPAAWRKTGEHAPKRRTPTRKKKP